MTFFNDNIVEEGLQKMHHVKIFKRCLAQPRLLLRTFLLGMLLTGCFGVMAGLGVSMASAQSLTGQGKSHHKSHSQPKNDKQKNSNAKDAPVVGGKDVPTGKGADTTGKGTGKGADTTGKGAVPVGSNQNTGAVNNAAGSNNTAVAPAVGAVPGAAGRGGGVGLPFTGSDPGNNPLP